MNDTHVFAFPRSSHSFHCSVCRASLPSGHLLDLHMAEAHDSFFAAQAAKKMRVYRCLVEVSFPSKDSLSRLEPLHWIKCDLTIAALSRSASL